MSTARPRIVVTDWTFPDLDIEREIIQAGECEMVSRQCRGEAELIELVSDATSVITQFAQINRAVIGAMNQARAIVRYGIGVDNIDLAAARQKGIPVCNIPDYCLDEVADHTLALMLGLTRQVAVHTQHVRAGHWTLAVPMSGMQALKNLAVGVIGFGRIGREVVRRLRGFKCPILACDPMVAPEEIRGGGAHPSTLEALLKAADIITLHCPSTAETRGLISRERIAQMKPGVLLVNVARGSIVDSAALTSALQQRRIAGAALDVFDPEPIPAGHAILGMGNVILSPHLASVSPEAVRTLRETTARLAVAGARGAPLANVVNK